MWTNQYLINQNTKSHQSLSSSIVDIQDNITMAKHNLSGIKGTAERSMNVLRDTNQTSKNVLSEVSALKSTIGYSLASLQEHVSARSLDSEYSNQSLRRDILQQIDAGFSRQTETQAQAYPLLLAGFSQLLDAALREDRVTLISEKQFTNLSREIKSPESSTDADAINHLLLHPQVLRGVEETNSYLT